MDLTQVGRTFGPFTREYGWRDVVLYHLGIGFRAEDLEYVYEGARGGLKVCPTFAVSAVLEPYLVALRGFSVDLATILHAEQSAVFHRPLPVPGLLTTTVTVPAVYDKQSAALLVAETRSEDAVGRLLFETRAAVFCRGAGGWGGDPGPHPEEHPLPDRKPDFVNIATTAENQAALYRLSGDSNPLHIDPDAARGAGFPRPVLHGLCTFGFAARAVLEQACGNDPRRLLEFGARFREVVYPGQTITTKGWTMDGGLLNLGVTTESGAVLANAYARVA